MKFTKMHGIGNDFVVINAITEFLPKDLVKLARGIADRKFGVGCDQVLIVDKSARADFKMSIFNADGSQVEMCGNGIRCLAKYVHQKGLTSKKRLTVETLAGLIRPELVGSNVRVDMGEPKLVSKDWHSGETIQRPFEVEGQLFGITLVSMGNPHCVIFVPEITDELVLKVGPKIENHLAFPNRINVEFVKVVDPIQLQMRVWERGAGETLACGTGSCAAGVAAILNQLTKNNVTIHLKGGDLEIEWYRKNVFMTGPAEFVFEGEILQ